MVVVVVMVKKKTKDWRQRQMGNGQRAKGKGQRAKKVWLRLVRRKAFLARR